MTDNLIVRTDTRGICTIAFNRPDSLNAFDPDVIEDLTIQLTFAGDDDFVRAIVITGEGPTFSSGADINWLKSMIKHDHETNSMEALKMAQMLQKLFAMPKPTLAKINGPAFGGALGIIACCDIAIAVNTSHFAFPEVTLGIVPAVISPFIVNAIGHRTTRRLFMTGDTFGSDDALAMGLVHKVVHHSLLEEAIDEELESLLQGGPSAQVECKRLLHKLAGISDDISEYTAEIISQIRISKEGQEGLEAFLEKRNPGWVKDSD